MKISSFQEMVKAAEGIKQRVAVVAAESEEVLLAVDKAVSGNIIEAILVGDEDQIKACLQKIGTKGANYQIVHQKDPVRAADQAVELVAAGKADLLMKGKVETGDFYKAIFREKSLKTEERVCSVVAVENESLNRIVLLADVGVNISPNTEEKASIIRSSIDIANALGMTRPKVAVLAAIDKVDAEKMPCTKDAAQLQEMCESGGFGDAVVEGPVSMDIAVNKRAAEIKQYAGKIQGDADILIAPDLQAGNILIKGLMFLSEGNRIAGVGAGTRVPTIVTTRGDTEEGKFHSIVLACLLSKYYSEE
jgi:phosphate butyryltransferase